MSLEGIEITVPFVGYDMGLSDRTITILPSRGIWVGDKRTTLGLAIIKELMESSIPDLTVSHVVTDLYEDRLVDTVQLGSIVADRFSQFLESKLLMR